MPLARGVGEQLFTGAFMGPAPTLAYNTGAFTMTDLVSDGTVTLTITNVSAVPEPESYALLLAGLGVTGFVVSRRRQA